MKGPEVAVRPLAGDDRACGSCRPSPPASTTSCPASAALPPGVRLCNARASTTPAPPSWPSPSILASLRGIPGFVRGQDAEEWRAGFYPALADKSVLIVGYGSIGARHRGPARALRVRAGGARRTLRAHHRARPGARRSPSCPQLLPEADVVVLSTPLTDATRGLAGAEFLAG